MAGKIKLISVRKKRNIFRTALEVPERIESAREISFSAQPVLRQTQSQLCLLDEFRDQACNDLWGVLEAVMADTWETLDRCGREECGEEGQKMFGL